MNSGSIAIALNAEYGRLLARSHFVQRQQLQHAAAGVGKPGAQRRQIADIADPPAGCGRCRKERDEQAGAPAAGGRVHARSGVQVEVPEHARHPVAKQVLRRQQAQDDVSAALKVEKVSGVRQHAVASRAATGPAPLRRRSPARGARHTIRPPPRAPCSPTRLTHSRRGAGSWRPHASGSAREPRARLQEPGSRLLHRRRDRQVRISGEFQPRERLIDQRGWSRRSDPRQLGLRQTDRLRQPAESERQTRVAPASGMPASADLRQLVIDEDFVGDDRRAARRRQRRRAARARAP